MFNARFSPLPNQNPLKYRGASIIQSVSLTTRLLCDIVDRAGENGEQSREAQRNEILDAGAQMRLDYAPEAAADAISPARRIGKLFFPHEQTGA